jgi:acetyl esterase/lipase
VIEWPEEFEPLREEARVMARLAADVYAAEIGSVPAEDHVRASRAFIAQFETEAPDGRDVVVAGVPCRSFDPPEPRGTYLHLHSGAMMYGSPRMSDLANSRLANALQVRVISVDYRLAPEHPYPAGVDDCVAVARWLLDEEDGSIAIGGESAGAYYSAVTLLRLRDEFDLASRIAGANLVFGIYDLSGTPSNRGARPSSVPDILQGSRAVVRGHFLPGRSSEELRDPSISPLYADLHGLPPALFTVGLADSLLDDSLFMAARWSAYGNQSELAVYPDCPHGFVEAPTELAARARGRAEAFLGEVLVVAGAGRAAN